MVSPGKFPEVYTSAAALLVALVKNELWDEAEDFVEWCIDNLELDLNHLLPAELED